MAENTHAPMGEVGGMEQRYVKDSIEADLADRMVFIGGPRQVGKTTLALSCWARVMTNHRQPI